MNKFDPINLSQADAENLRDILLKMYPTTKKKQLTKWEPQKDDDVFVVTSYGVRRNTWIPEDITLKKLFSAGLLKHTEEEAKYYYNHRYIRNLVEEEAKLSPVNWDDPKQNKYCIAYDLQQHKLVIKATKFKITDDPWFKNKDKLTRVIQDIGEDVLLAYYFPMGMIK